MFFNFLNEIGELNDLWAFNITSKLWTWISGDDKIGSGDQASYGTFRVSSPQNEPLSRYRHSMTFDPYFNLIFVLGGRSDSGTDTM